MFRYSLVTSSKIRDQNNHFAMRTAEVVRAAARDQWLALGGQVHSVLGFWVSGLGVQALESRGVRNQGKG